MRLIDADVLIERMKSEWDMQDLYLPVHFEDLVEEQPTVGEWISVKDRLPERKEYLHESNVIRGSSEYVLVYISATFPYKRMFVTIGRYSYDEMYPRWIVRSSHDGDVTHWMPLPEPPSDC